MFTVPVPDDCGRDTFSDSLTIVVRPNGVVALKTDDNYREVVGLDGVGLQGRLGRNPIRP